VLRRANASRNVRAWSTLDIALWDLLGQHLGEPVYNLIGGRCRDSIPVYNTCVNTPKYSDLLEECDTPESGYEIQPLRSGLLIACACVGDRDLWKPPGLIGYNGQNSRRKVQNFVTDSCGGA
jgi:hypothetical protein